ncbi:MAG: PTS system mannose/fructose/sorbose family transporter subunit IID [Erysipelotrichaceae bacterium]
MNSNQKIKKRSEVVSNRVFWQCYFRSCTLDSTWNYERQQHLAYAYAMTPIIREYYQNQNDRAEAMQRHMEFMAVTPQLSTLLIGVSGAMEIENANNQDFDQTSINAVKTSLMGPVAGVGDSFFWGTLKVIASGIAISLSTQGNILGPILFLLIINVPGFLLRYFSLDIGFKYGTKFFGDNENSHVVQKLTKSMTIVGLMVIGGMISSMIYFELPFMIGSGDIAEPVQTYIDQIMPSFFPLLLFLLMYYLSGKKIKTTTILSGLLVVSIILAGLGIV